MKNWEQLKNKTTTQSGSVISMFEQEEIRHGKMIIRRSRPILIKYPNFKDFPMYIIETSY